MQVLFFQSQGFAYRIPLSLKNKYGENYHHSFFQVSIYTVAVDKQDNTVNIDIRYSFSQSQRILWQHQKIYIVAI